MYRFSKYTYILCKEINIEAAYQILSSLKLFIQTTFFSNTGSLQCYPFQFGRNESTNVVDFISRP